jgi:hypothetical protein
MFISRANLLVKSLIKQVMYDDWKRAWGGGGGARNAAIFCVTYFATRFHFNIFW